MIRFVQWIVKSSVCLFAAVSFVLFVASPSSAQIARLLGNSKLKPEDIELATQTAADLYTKPGVKVGDKATWANEDTGARGVVEITKVERDGTCVSFVHTTEAGVQKRTQAGSRQCRNADGTWAFSPE